MGNEDLKDEKKEQKHSFIFLLLILTSPLAGVGISLFVPSLPAIAQQLDASETWVKFTLTYYLIGYAIGTPVFGSLSDSIGRKIPFILGIILYIGISFLLSLSENIQFMLWMRLLQGFVVGAPGTISKAIVADVYKGKQLVKVSSSVTVLRSLGPIVAPVVGGYIEAFFGWKGNFYCFTIYGIAILLVAIFTFEETHFDRIPLNFSNLFKAYRKALSHKGFVGALICIAIGYSLMLIFNVMGPFLIETIMDYSPITYGHLAFFVGLGIFLGSSANRILIHHFPYSKILPISIYCAFATSWIMVLLALIFHLNIFVLIICSFFILFFGGFTFSNSMTACFSLLPASAGTVTALMGSFAFGSVLISAIANFLNTSSLLPISLLYFCVMTICLFAYFFLIRTELEKQ